MNMNMNYALRQIEQALTKNAVPRSMADVFDEIPSYQDTNHTLKALESHRREVVRWVHGEVSKEKARISRDNDALTAQRQKKATAVLDGLSVFGIEPTGPTIDDYEAAWDRVADRLDRKRRDDRLLGRAQDSDTGVATIDPAVTDARALRDAIDGVRDLDTRMAAVEARIDAVDPYEIDERTVGYLDGYAAVGLLRDPDDGGRPVMDPELRTRAEQLNILGHGGSVM